MKRLHPSRSSRFRRKSRWIGLALVGLGLGIGTLPWWLGWLVPPVAAAFGAQVQKVKVAGWWRWQCEGVRVDASFGWIEAEQLAILQPVGWLVERWLPGRVVSTEKPAIELSRWRVAVAADAAREGTAAPVDSPAVVLDRTHELLRRLVPWVRQIRGAAGVIEVGDTVVRVPELNWGSGRLTAKGLVAGRPEPIALSVEPARPDGMRLEAFSGEHRLRLELRREAAAGVWIATGDLALAGVSGEIHARWQREKSMLTTAEVKWRMEHWPEEWWKRPGFVDGVSGSGNLRWEAGRGTVDLRLAADLKLPGLPSSHGGLELTAIVEEEPWRLDLRSLRITAPGLAFRLPAAVRVSLTQPLALQPASSELEWEIDAAPWTSGACRGVILGRVAVWLDPTNGLPAATFRLSAEALRWRDRLLGPLAAEGRLQWPSVRIEGVQLGLPETGLWAAGAWNLKEKRLEDASWRLTGLPTDLVGETPLQRLRGKGTLQGPWNRLEHQGWLEAGLGAVGPLKPLALSLGWHGVGGRLNGWEGRVEADTAAWRLAGSAEVGVSPVAQASLRLEQADWVRGKQVFLALQRPGFIRVVREAAGWAVAVDSLAWGGGKRQLGLGGRWHQSGQGRVHLEASGWEVAEIGDWIQSAPADLGLDRLDLQAGWGQGPMVVELGMKAGWRPPGRPGVQVELAASGSEQGLQVRQLAVRLGKEPVAEGGGAIPVVLEFGGEGSWLRWLDGESWRFGVATVPGATVWERLPAWTGVEVEAPALALEIEGPARSPAGRLRLAAGGVRSLNQWNGLALPALDQPRLTLTWSPLNRVGLVLESLVAGQALELEAAAPLPTGLLFTNSLAGCIPPPERWSGRLRLDHWRLEPLVREGVGRQWLAPSGEIEADLRLAPGLTLTGHVTLTNLATHPLPALGVVRRVHGQVAWTGHRAELHHAGAMLGSQPVELEGEWEFWPGFPGRLALHLRGDKLPVLRQPDLILRVAPDLWLRADSWTNAVISGQVTLQQSLLLRDLASLVSPDVKTAAARPPYFRIEIPPFRDWKLSVAMRGEEFMQIVTPVFRGRVSAVMQMAGTLGDPQLIGDLTVPSGVLLFPFGALRMQAGRVTLSQSDPHMPQLSLRAEGLNFGYQVQMEITGPAAEPKVFFSSVPPLSSMQILLMLTSGDIPGEAFNYSGRGRMQQIGMFLGKEFLGRLTGDPEDDRLTIRSGQEVSDRGQLTYQIEYRLSERWSLFGARDRFDNYGGGVKWRVYSR